MGTTATAAQIPATALDLHESAYALPLGSVEMPRELIEAHSEAVREKMVPLVIIRPGLGKGRGRHLYPAQMLQENAHKFSGWKMFVDHLSPEARKAAGGLPRSMRDLGGIIMESHWDATLPADDAKGHGQGGVVGWAIPTPFIRELIDTAPELVEASISANATGVRAGTSGGKRAWIVEGIEDRGSVDWVTEAGAGGRVVALMEAAYSEEEQMGLLETMTDDEFIAYVEEKRPHLVEAAEPEATPGAAPEGGPTTTSDQEKDMTITPEALAEAFKSDAVRDALADTVKDIVKDEVAAATKSAVEEAVSDERDLIRAEARADADRQIQLRDLRDEARVQIQEAKLPDVLAERVRARFTLQESGDPTPALDVVDEVDDGGKVTKTAREKLTEAVETEIAAEREVMAAVNPSRVRGQGPKAETPEGEKPKRGEGTFYGSVLQEAGIDPATAWGE